MNFLAGAFRIGQAFGINIRVHFLFVIWIAFRVLMEASQGGDVTGELMFLGMLFGIVLLHEFGHCFGARSVGGDARDILMWPLGGLAYAHAPMRPWPQFVTVAAGPAVNVGFCIISAAVLIAVTGGGFIPGINPISGKPIYVHESAILMFGYTWFNVLWTFYHVNLFLLAFNLLPIYPLDGGQIFHAIIWPFVGLQRASIIAAQVGLAGCVALGLWSLADGGGGMLFFIAIFGGFTCWQRYQAARQGWLVEDPVYSTYTPPRQGGGFWSRIFKRKPGGRGPSRPIEYPNPNPGGWEQKQADSKREEEELDRLLKKVSENGVQSLSYVERQKLERITRQRQKREREFQRDNRV